ncbi:DNA primase small subunit-like [Uloborus diversus]|uniref:DNA primase small subunit-like n=1 Tax=Uloborus diversus TaxID=327109 RepID=UPI0024094390|nr:DNA primase small subunit-like [Uloborus diversus]
MEVDEVDENFDDSFDPSVFQDLLPIYYRRLFPFSLYYKWLRYDDDKQFTNREFSFTLRDDVYIRYQSFKDDEEMKKEVLQRCPVKIDIGSVYNFRPSEQRTASNFHPLTKELAFDIDMTDYDEVRTCCSGADICKKCWPLMTVALKILDRALREDFGFKHLLWVYSGRRGIHCWVCDKQARELTPAARTAIVEYLSLVKGGEFKSKKVYLPETLHPSIKEAHKIIDSYFEDLMLTKQCILDSQENCEKVISMCLDNNAKEYMKNEFGNCQNSKSKWEKIQDIDSIAMHQKTASKSNRNKHFIMEVMLQLCYPRLDINVSKGLHHLLKAPFSVHPKTGRVCVPIDVDKVDEFDPFKIPTISSLCREIDKYDATVREKNESGNGEDVAKVEDYNKTSLSSSIKLFRNFVKNLSSDFDQ